MACREISDRAVTMIAVDEQGSGKVAWTCTGPWYSAYRSDVNDDFDTSFDDRVATVQIRSTARCTTCSANGRGIDLRGAPPGVAAQGQQIRAGASNAGGVVTPSVRTSQRRLVRQT